MTSELKLDKGSDAVVVHGGIKATFNASGITVNVRGATITIDENGTVAMQTAANDTAKPAAARKTLEVGEHLQDGTVVIAVDLKNDKALFAPEGIFGGNARFNDQDQVVDDVNANKLHEHNDWRLVTDAEGKKLSDAWDKVAPPTLQGSAAPWFWLASPSFNGSFGRVRRGGEADWFDYYRVSSLPVPVVRSGPARS